MVALAQTLTILSNGEVSKDGLLLLSLKRGTILVSLVPNMSKMLPKQFQVYITTKYQEANILLLQIVVKNVKSLRFVNILSLKGEIKS